MYFRGGKCNGLWTCCYISQWVNNQTRDMHEIYIHSEITHLSVCFERKSVRPQRTYSEDMCWLPTVDGHLSKWGRDWEIYRAAQWVLSSLHISVSTWIALLLGKKKKISLLFQRGQEKLIQRMLNFSSNKPSVWNSQRTSIPTMVKQVSESGALIDAGTASSWTRHVTQVSKGRRCCTAKRL